MPGVEPDAATVILDDLATERETDAGALVGVAGVQALKDEEDPFRILGLDAQPVVAADQFPPVSLLLAETRTTGGSSPRNLSELEIRFWNNEASCPRSPLTLGSSPTSSRAGSDCSGPREGQADSRLRRRLYRGSHASRGSVSADSHRRSRGERDCAGPSAVHGSVSVGHAERPQRQGVDNAETLPLAYTQRRLP